MADVNFGILNTAPEQIRTSMGPGASASAPTPPQGGILGGLAQGAKDMVSMDAERQRMGLLQAQGAREAAMAPGQLQGQALANQGQSIQNQNAQAQQAAQQYAIKIRQESAAAYQEGEAKGGVKGGFDAAAQRMAQLGDVEGAMKLASSSEDLQSKISKGNIDELTRVGSAIHGVMSGVTAQKDSLQSYAEQYPQIKRLDPKAPEPKSFKNAQQFEDTYVHPVLATALPYQKLQAQQADMLSKNALAQANTLVQNAQSDFNTALRTKGANSPETMAAAQALSNAQGAAKRAAVGGGLTAGLESHLPVSLGGLEKPEDIIKKNTPAAAPAVPAGRIAVKNAQGEIGHIPSDQLQDALKSGYTQVQ